MSNNTISMAYIEYMRRIIGWTEIGFKNPVDGFRARRTLLNGEFVVSDRPFERGFHWVVRRDIIVRLAGVNRDCRNQR